jgi:hypothetical protein
MRPRRPWTRAPSPPLPPPQVAAVRSESGLTSFSAVALGAPGHAPLGALLLGSREPARFNDTRCAWRAAGAACRWLTTPLAI